MKIRNHDMQMRNNNNYRFNYYIYNLYYALIFNVNDKIKISAIFLNNWPCEEILRSFFVHATDIFILKILDYDEILINH